MWRLWPAATRCRSASSGCSTSPAPARAVTSRPPRGDRVTAAGAHARSSLSIGELLGQLRPEFPDITISKIRFLEAEGLIHPERTPSGYRKFSSGDVARLRFVLAEQRDHYLPLRVIKEHLDAVDRGLEPPEH